MLIHVLNVLDQEEYLLQIVYVVLDIMTMVFLIVSHVAINVLLVKMEQIV